MLLLLVRSVQVCKMALPSDVVIGKLHESAFDPIIQITYEDLEQHGGTTWYRLSAWVKTIDHHPLSATCEPISYPSRRPPIMSVSCQFVQEEATGNNVEHFAEVQVRNINCSRYVDRGCYFVVEGDRVIQHDLP